MNRISHIFPRDHPAGKLQRLKALLAYRRQRKHWLRTEDWRQRLAVAAECPDNKHLAHIENAGCVQDDWILMHNGLWVESGGYYGSEANLLLTGNRGVHEPQEEHLFSQIIQALPARAVILELGAYWGFYSMWFKRDVPDSRCYLVEAERDNIRVGERNFRRNKLLADGVLWAKVGASDTPDQPPTVTLDRILNHFSLQHLDVLHADIQGHEYNMLLGGTNALANQLVDIMFISTHSMGIHYQCKAYLEKAGYLVPWTIDCVDSYSFDGLLVAHLPKLLADTRISVSLRSASL